MKEYVERLQIWRDRYESHLEARPRIQPLNLISHWLVEFQHLKYDDVEIPGQYLEVSLASIGAGSLISCFLGISA